MAYTKQETFDMAVGPLLVQGRPSLNNGTCAYRGEDGCRCAIGWIIPDDEYDPLMEGIGVSLNESAQGRWKELRDLIIRLGHDIELASELQAAHDETIDESICDDGWNSFPQFAREVAESFNLSTAVIDKWEAENATS